MLSVHLGLPCRPKKYRWVCGTFVVWPANHRAYDAISLPWSRRSVSRTTSKSMNLTKYVRKRSSSFIDALPPRSRYVLWSSFALESELGPWYVEKAE